MPDPSAVRARPALPPRPARSTTGGLLLPTLLASAAGGFTVLAFAVLGSRALAAAGGPPELRTSSTAPARPGSPPGSAAPTGTGPDPSSAGPPPSSIPALVPASPPLARTATEYVSGPGGRFVHRPATR